MYKNIFYWLYYYCSTRKKEEDPEFLAYGFLFWVQLFNFVTVYVALNACFNFDHGEFSPYFNVKNRFSIEGLITCIVFALPFFTLNYIYIYRKKRRKEIIEKYKRLKGKERMKSKAFFWIYVILSPVLCIYISETFPFKDRDGNILKDRKHKREYHFPARGSTIRYSTQIYIPDMPPELHDAASYMLWNEAQSHKQAEPDRFLNTVRFIMLDMQ
ncbi:MAG: hypothetical protein LBJ63_07335 [Prevotellaceae bacterium]|jgi:hypothetical protein|nr:hypothetical protein [Prevotellaceae bacterium]